MRIRTSHRCRRARSAFTLLEMLLVAVIILILATLMLPVLSKAKGRAYQIDCLNQLRQVGIASQNFAHDHGDLFPFQVPVKDGGTLELAKSVAQGGPDVYFAFRHFQALSNDLILARMLRCPSDNRVSATTFDELKNDNVSYFLAVTADMSKPDSLLAGDRNIISGDGSSGSILKLTAINGARWTRAIHEFKGNLLFAGGHVERTGNEGLQVALRNPDGPVKVWVPSAAPASQASSSSGGGRNSSGSSAAGGSAGNGGNGASGFDALQRFFATPQGSSGAQSVPPTPPPRAPEIVTGPGKGTFTPEPPPPVQPPPPEEPKPAPKPPVMAAVAAPVLEEPAAPPAAIDPEPAAVPMAFLVEPERCWWCWWLVLAAGLLTAFILGFIVHRRRRARQMAQGWTPDWQRPQSAGRR